MSTSDDPPSTASRLHRNVRHKWKDVMKRSTLLPALLFLGLVAVTRESSAQATQATFAIPFKFEAGGKSFPAGDYAISKMEKGRLFCDSRRRLQMCPSRSVRNCRNLIRRSPNLSSSSIWLVISSPRTANTLQIMCSRRYGYLGATVSWYWRRSDPGSTKRSRDSRARSSTVR